MDIITIFSLAGGLGLFLYGMKLMGDGLTSVAGAKLRNILEKMTKNVVVGTLVGTIFTAIIQSSSATTALVVGFVNADLMNLYQAAGVIMGANIGTTATGILMTINLAELAPLFVFIGVVMIQFIKKPAVNKVGQIILGFGILFVGLTSMSSALNGLKSSPVVVDILTSLSNPILAILIGVVVTGVLQSASAMVGILIVLASQGLISLEISFYLTLGCNIGCTFTAILASIGGSVDGKRAAAIHFIINVIGTIVMGTLLALFMPQMISFITNLTGSATATGAALGDALGRDVAYSNTIFKIFQILICLPFYKYIVNLTMKIIPDEKKKKSGFGLEYIQDQASFSSATAIPQIIHEVERMFNFALENLNLSVNSLLEVDTSTLEHIKENEAYIDFLNHAINEYLRFANQMGLPKDDSMMVGPLFHVVADIERIGDHASSISNITKKCDEKGITFTDEHKIKIRELLTMVNSELEFGIDMFSKKTLEHLSEILKLENLIDQKEKDLQHEYLSNIKNKKTKPRAGMLFSDLAANLERVADHGTNIAFSILNDDSEEVNRLLEEEHVDQADYIL
jgi:Na+/phosphate symporter